MTYGERIKRRRIELGLSAEELADYIGKSRATIYRYENGDIEDMPITIIEPLAEALCTTPDYLMGWDNDPNDYDLIGGEEGICPPSDYDGNYEAYVKYKITEEQHDTYETKDPLILEHYDSLNDIGKHEATKRVEELTYIPIYQKHLEVNAAHERTDIELTEEMRKHDDDIMNDENF